MSIGSYTDPTSGSNVPFQTLSPGEPTGFTDSFGNPVDINGQPIGTQSPITAPTDVTSGAAPPDMANAFTLYNLWEFATGGQPDTTGHRGLISNDDGTPGPWNPSNPNNVFNPNNPDNPFSWLGQFATGVEIVVVAVAVVAVLLTVVHFIPASAPKQGV